WRIRTMATTHKNQFRPSVEPLEERALLSVTSAMLGGGQVTIRVDNHDSSVHTYLSGGKFVVQDDAPGGFYLIPPRWTFDSSKVSKVLFYGGSGNDRVVNDVAAVALEAYGYGGNDYLQGANLARDRLFGGAGVNTYREPFNLDRWFVGGYTATDVDQANSPTCTFLAALAEAADR